MSALINWISQMIILVVIMMITSMILPDHKMKKYAQFSLSLIFIFFFIQPLTDLFSLNLRNESSRVIESIIGDIPSREVENQIDLKKRDIQASNDAYIISELTNQLKNEIEAEFSNDFNYHLKDITITPENHDDIHPEALAFHITISESGRNIAKIAPVIINTDQTVTAEDEVFREDDQDIIIWFSEKLGIDQTQVQLSWEGG